MFLIGDPNKENQLERHMIGNEFLTKIIAFIFKRRIEQINLKVKM